MNKRSALLLGGIMTTVMVSSLLATIPLVYGHPHPGVLAVDKHTHEPTTETIPIDGLIGIQKTVVFMHAPGSHTLSWAFVEGKVVDHVTGYPVIIQIYKEGEPVHFAQTDVEEDGSYEYRFRVRNVDNGQIVYAFEGDYTVNIFKVIYLNPEPPSSSI